MSCLLYTSGVEDLKAEGFKGIFVASGAGLPNFMNIPGENSINIMSSNEYPVSYTHLIVNAVIDNLNLESFKKLYKETGRCPYHPKMMLKVIILSLIHI